MIIDAVELQRRFLLRIDGVRDKKVYVGPQIVDLDINNSCNLSCQYCWTHAPGNPAHFEKARYFPWEKFTGIIADCVDLKVDEICITGTGEPTMHPLYRDMMRHLENKSLKVKLRTNATFPLDYCLDVVKGDHVIVDLSAVDRQQYQEIQGKDLFDRVVANIKRLVALRDTVKPGFVIEITYIVNAANVDQKQKMQDLALELGINSVYFSKMNVHAYNRKIAFPEGPQADLDADEKRTPPVCLNGWFYMVIKSGDDTSTCCRIHQMRHLSQGDVDQWSLKQLWFSSSMMNVRLLGKYGHIQKMYKACQTCAYYDENIQRAQALAGLEKNEQTVAS